MSFVHCLRREELLCVSLFCVCLACTNRIRSLMTIWMHHNDPHNSDEPTWHMSGPQLICPCIHLFSLD